jgi:hypothetical protein
MYLKYILTVMIVIGLVASSLYAKDDKSKKLPQGLQKKLDKGQDLPPGWQKKLIVGERLDKSVVDHGKIVVPLDSKGLLTVSLDGKLVRFVKATREIVDVLE